MNEQAKLHVQLASGSQGHPVAAANPPRPAREGTAGQTISVVSFEQLRTEQLQRWEQLRQASDCWSQPFFSPRFSAAVHRARGDVLVAVISASSAAGSSVPVGFLPFHRVGRVGTPVGRFLNDAQNVIGIAAESVDWRSLLHACELVAFNFHAITNPAASWYEKYRLRSVGAYQADLAGDSVAYLRHLETTHRTIAKQGQKTRKLAREVGDVRLEVDCRCPKVLAQTIAWKREQYQRTHILDLFLPDWTRRMLQTLHGEDDFSPACATAPPSRVLPMPASQAPSQATAPCFAKEPLRGLLSVLWAGDRVVAAHLGMIERGRLHYWFPTYAPEFSRYSPGTALFTELVRRSTGLGIDCIDMGYGEQPYKQKQTATVTRVASGTITDSRWHRLAHTLSNTLSHYAKQLPMKEQLKKAWRAINPTAGIKKLG